MKNPSIYLAVALVFVLGLFVGQTTAQDPIRIDKPGVVHVLPDQNVQELSDLIPHSSRDNESFGDGAERLSN